MSVRTCTKRLGALFRQQHCVVHQAKRRCYASAATAASALPTDMKNAIDVSACQNRETKSLSRSDTMLDGRPFSQYHAEKNNFAKCSADTSVRVGIRRMSLFSRSVIVAMQLKPSSSGRGPMKSIAILSHRRSGTGSGWRGPVGLRVRFLFL